MNSFNPDYFIHGANVLLLLAYSVPDILWLRLFALASSLIAVPYFFLQPGAVNWMRELINHYLNHELSRLSKSA